MNKYFYSFIYHIEEERQTYGNGYFESELPLCQKLIKSREEYLINKYNFDYVIILNIIKLDN